MISALLRHSLKYVPAHRLGPLQARDTPLEQSPFRLLLVSRAVQGPSSTARIAGGA